MTNDQAQAIAAAVLYAMQQGCFFPPMTDDQAQAIAAAVLYAMQQGCFFPVPEPRPPYSIERLRQWGALRHLHDVVAEATRAHEERS